MRSFSSTVSLTRYANILAHVTTTDIQAITGPLTSAISLPFSRTDFYTFITTDTAYNTPSFTTALSSTIAKTLTRTIVRALSSTFF